MRRLMMIIPMFLVVFSCFEIATVHAQDDIPPCRVDYDKNGVVNWDDIIYLATEYSGDDLIPLLNVYDDDEYNSDDVDAIIALINAQPTVDLADYDENGIVSASDLSTFLGAYGTFNPCIDLTGDGWVYPADLVQFLSVYWGTVY